MLIYLIAGAVAVAVLSCGDRDSEDNGGEAVRPPSVCVTENNGWRVKNKDAGKNSNPPADAAVEAKADVPDSGVIPTDAACYQAPLGLAESFVVCGPCSTELLDAKTRGIRAAMADLVDFVGADILPEHSPATFSLSSDEWCGEYKPGWTGFIISDGCRHARLCLFDADKHERICPFTPENADRPRDQMLAIHEAMHAWFAGRVEDYYIQEPFCHFVSFEISGALMNGTNPDPCSWFVSDTPYPDRLMFDLCGLGMDAPAIGEILRRTAIAAATNRTERGTIGQTISSEKFANIVSEVLERDAIPAFRAAGIAGIL